MKKIPRDSHIRPRPNITAKKLQEKDSDPCHGCTDCCQYVAVEIPAPASIDDFQGVFWYLVHRKIWVYIDHDHDWYVQFNSHCEKLDDGRCSEYEQRPEICRDYLPDHCTRYNEEAAEKILLKSEDDLWEFLKHQRPTVFQKMKKYMSKVKEVVPPVSGKKEMKVS